MTHSVKFVGQLNMWHGKKIEKPCGIEVAKSIIKNNDTVATKKKKKV